MSDVASRVRDLIAEHFGRSADEINDDMKFVDDLGADSLDPLELAMNIEDACGVDIDLNAEVKWATVGEAVEHVRQLAGEAVPA